MGQSASWACEPDSCKGCDSARGPDGLQELEFHQLSNQDLMEAILKC